MGAMATEFRTFQNINGYSYDADKTDTIYAEDLNKISEAIEDLETQVAGIVAAAVVAAKEAIYPVGSIYHNETDDRNPSVILGFGEWEASAPGRVLVGKAASGTFATAGATGGEETHTLTIAEMPLHDHNIDRGRWWGADTAIGGSDSIFNQTSTTTSQGETKAGLGNRKAIGTRGGGGSHNNLQPYKVVYRWVRVA